jgi:hemoglobin
VQGDTPGGETGSGDTGSGDVPVYDAVGGMPFFVGLVDRFYAHVARDIMLRPLYPSDLGPPADHLALFLAQYWGGPTTYSEGRGHPRLRMRHAPFAIGRRERDRWLLAMTSALDEMERDAPLDPDVRRRFDAYFVMAADSLINS